MCVLYVVCVCGMCVLYVVSVCVWYVMCVCLVYMCDVCVVCMCHMWHICVCAHSTCMDVGGRLQELAFCFVRLTGKRPLLLSHLTSPFKGKHIFISSRINFY